MDKVKKLFELDSYIPECKQVIVPLNEDDYRDILINTSKEILNKIIIIYNTLNEQAIKHKGGGDNIPKKSLCYKPRIKPIYGGWKKYQPEWLKNCEYISKGNFNVGDFGGGGDCQFLAIAASLNISKYDDRQDYTCQKIRNRITEYINKLDQKKLEKLFELYNALKDDQEKKESFEWMENINSPEQFKKELIERIKKPGTDYEGDHFTLKYISKIYNIGFIIFNNEDEFIFNIPGKIIENNKQYIYLNYLGRAHYQLIIQQKDNKSLFSGSDIQHIDICQEYITKEGIKKRNEEENEQEKLDQIFENVLPIKKKEKETQTRITISSNEAYKKYKKSISEKKEKPLSPPDDSLNEEIKKVYIEEIQNPNTAILYFKKDSIDPTKESREMVKIDPNSSKNIKNISLKILAKKYIDLLDSFIKYMQINGKNKENKYIEIIKIRNCYQNFINHIHGNIFNYKTCTFENVNNKLIFTRGIINYLEKLDYMFKQKQMDKKYLENIPKNIMMIIGVMNYIIEQIYALRINNDVKKQLEEESKKIEELYGYIVVPKVIKYLAVPIRPKYLAIADIPSYIAIPTKPKYVAIQKK